MLLTGKKSLSAVKSRGAGEFRPTKSIPKLVVIGGKLISRIREIVAHSSPGVREVIGGLAGYLPPRLRFGKDFTTTLGLIDRARSRPDWGRAEQRRLLTSLLSVATSAPYYNNRGLAADSVISKDPYETLRQFPVLEREDLVSDPGSFLTVDSSQVTLMSTSGSSGKPAVFWLNKRRGSSEWAYVCDAWRSAAYQPNAWRAVVRGIDLGQRRGRKFFRSRSTKELLFSAFNLDEQSVEEYWRLIVRHKVEFLHGYPSALSQFAQIALKSDSDHRYKIRGVFPVSESVLDAQSEVIIRAFPNSRVVPFYGLSERVAMAEFDAELDAYRFYPLYGFVEVVDNNGMPVEPGQRGRIISTGLRLTAAPLIRYDTGDQATLIGYDEFGGPIVRDLAGKRAQEHLVGNSGGLISSSALNLHSDSYEGIFAFRLVQEKKGEVDVLIVPAAGNGVEVAERLTKEFQDKCSQEIIFRAILKSQLPETINGKIRLIDQRIPGIPKE